jgi:hypothetical protein
MNLDLQVAIRIACVEFSLSDIGKSRFELLWNLGCNTDDVLHLTIVELSDNRDRKARMLRVVWTEWWHRRLRVDGKSLLDE